MKPSYTILIGVLAVLAFGAQFVGPWATMLVAMPGIMASTAQGMQLADLQGAAIVEGSLWFVNGRVIPYPAEPTHRRLCRVPLTGDGGLDCVLDLDLPDPVLLGADDGLWVLSLDRVARFRDGRLEDVPVEGRPGGFSSPFLLEGKPAAVVARPDSRSIRVLEGGRWTERWSLPLGRDDVPKDDLRAVAAPDGVHLFVRRGGTIFHRIAGPEPVVPFDDGWEAVAPAPGRWTVVANPSPVVFVGPKEPSGTIHGYRRGESDWEPAIELPMSAMTVGFGVFPATTKDSVLVVSTGPFGSGRIVEVGETGTRRERKFGRNPFGKMMPLMMGGMFGSMFAVGFGFAIVVSVVMGKFRAPDHVAGETSRAYAQLWRRAVAQLVDAAILFGPTAYGYYRMMSMFDDLDPSIGPARALGSMGWIFGGFFWAFLGLFWISALEGKWGITPGKWVVGIRTLGEDLKPCGFGRAILRNLLTVVDGFFNFLVGMILVALTERWQRVGDLVAKTVVVRAGAR